jgi:hypothetical protein
VGGSTGTGDARNGGRRRRGETVALRELWRGRVWYARPAVVVRDDPNLQMFHVPSHALCKEPVGADGTPLRLPTDTWELRDARRSQTRVLSFAFPDTPYAIVLPFMPDGRLTRYYVNLQSPLARSDAGFDTVEYLLDVTIPADRASWAWKDEDELAEAVDRGLFTAEDAAWFRSWGERAAEHVLLGEPPFDRTWEDWRPDPGWNEVALPPNWDTPPASETATMRGSRAERA